MERVADVLRPMMLRAAAGGRLQAPERRARAAARGRPGRRAVAARPARALPRDDDVGRRPARRLVRERRAQGRVRLDRRGRRVGRPAHARHRLQPAPPRARRARRRRRRVGARAAAGWARSREALAGSAQAHGAVVRTGAAVASIDVRDGRVRGVTLDGGESITAPIVMSGAHPKTTVLDLVGAEHFPDEVVEDMRRYRSRGGSVKVNWILSEPPQFDAPGVRRAAAHALAICPSIDYLERAWQDATLGKPGRGAVHRGRGADVAGPDADRRRHDGDDDVHPVRPARRGRLAGRRARGLRDALPRPDRRSTRRTCRDAVVHYEVLAPPDLERIFGLVGGSIFQGEQGLDQMAFMRPSPLLSRYATPVGRAVPVRRRHAPGRRRDRGRRAQRRASAC